VKDYISILDPVTGEERLAHYSELDTDVYPQLWRPVGGFCYSAEAFCRLTLAKAPFYLKDWLPKKGKMELYGQAKVGKSLLSLQLARCIGAGEPFLEIPTTQARVLYLQFELGQEILQDRLKKTGHTYEEVYLGTTFSLKLDKADGQKMLQEALEAVCPQVVIIDPLYKAIAGDENETHDMLSVADFLDQCIDLYNCSFVVIHHPGKDLSKGGRGSTVLEDWVDSYIEMKDATPKGGTKRMRLTPKLLRHAELPPEPIEAELTDFEFVRADPLDTIKSQVRTLLSESPAISFSISNIVDQGVGSRGSVNRAANELAEEGIVTKLPKGGYIWKGEKA